MEWIRIVLLAFFLAVSTAVKSQVVSPSNLEASYNSIQKQIEFRNFDSGLQMVQAVYDYWGKQAGDAIGDQFGHFYYLEGLLHFGKKDYGRAISAFTTCAEDFPDRKRNQFFVHALAQRGICELLSEDYRDAVKSLKQAFREAPTDKPEPDRNFIALNLARAFFGANDSGEALKILHSILDNADALPDIREDAFAILAEEWSPTATIQEVREAIDQYGAIARNSPIERRRLRNPLFHNLARKALKEEEPLLALLWYAQVAPPSQVVAWHETKLADLDRRKPLETHPNFRQWQDTRAEVAEGLKAGKLEAADILFGSGAAHFRMQNHAASFAAFQSLADRYPEYPRRAETLYNIVASAVFLQGFQDIQSYGLKFLDEFPKDSLVAEVARIMVETAFTRGDYEASWATARDVRQRFRIGAKARDVPDFVAGASLFHLERYREARVELEAYTYHYERGDRLEQVRYYLGATNVKALRWNNAAMVFDVFLDAYSNSDLRPGVLYLNGLTHYALGNLEEAKSMVNELQSDYPAAPEIAASWNLTGDLFSIQDEPAPVDEIEAAYQSALEVGARPDSPADSEVAAYALWKLIAIHHDAALWEKAVSYFDQFQASHKDSVYRLDALAAALAGLHRADRTSEAITLLEKNIREADPSSYEFDPLFGSYFDYINANLPPEEFISVLRTLADSTTEKPIKMWLVVGEIEHLEKKAEVEGSTGTLQKRYAALDLVASESSVPNYGLLKLADFHSKQKHHTRARELYNEIIENRPNRGYLEPAVLALATLDARSEDPVAVANAYQNFTRIIDEFDRPELYETATIGIARILFDQGNFIESESYLSYYLTRPDWRSARAEAHFKLARCYEESAKTNEAIKLYAATYVNFPGTLQWSTDAYLRAAKLLKNSDREGDALLVMVDFLKRLGHLEHENITEGRRLFARWKTEWIAKQSLKQSES